MKLKVVLIRLILNKTIRCALKFWSSVLFFSSWILHKVKNKNQNSPNSVDVLWVLFLLKVLSFYEKIRSNTVAVEETFRRFLWHIFVVDSCSEFITDRFRAETIEANNARSVPQCDEREFKLWFAKLQIHLFALIIWFVLQFGSDVFGEQSDYTACDTSWTDMVFRIQLIKRIKEKTPYRDCNDSFLNLVRLW